MHNRNARNDGACSIAYICEISGIYYFSFKSEMSFDRNASKDGFANQDVLPESDMYDCTLCACIADTDWDGQNEILIGTYGQVSCVHVL